MSLSLADMKPFQDQTYYELLEVSVTASDAEIRTAYERSMELYAPDSVALYAVEDPSRAEDLRARLHEAMEILTDVDLRQEYDRMIGVVRRKGGVEREPEVPREVSSLAATEVLAMPHSLASTHPEFSVSYVPEPFRLEPPPPRSGESDSAPVREAMPFVPPPAATPARGIDLRAALAQRVDTGRGGRVSRAGESLAAEESRSRSTSVEAPRFEALRSEASPEESSPLEALRPGVQREDVSPVEAFRTEAVRSEASRLDAVHPDAVHTDAVHPDAVRPDAARLEVSRPDATRPEVSRPDAARLEAVRLDQGRAEGTHPEGRPVDLPRAAPLPSRGGEPVSPSRMADPVRAGDEFRTESPRASDARPASRALRGLEAAQLSEESAIATAESAMAQVSAKVRGEPKPVKGLDLPADAEFNGELLRRVRESRGLTILQVAERTRISRSHLENVEADRYKALPAVVYLRGILMNLAREYGLDALRVSKSYLALAVKKG